METHKGITRRLKKKRKHRPHAEHYEAARVFCANAEKNQADSGLQLQASLLFSAFCIEAYLNLMGSTCLRYWDEIDKAPVLAKLRLLMAEFRVHFEEGKRPLQTVSDLFRYRNWMAHSKAGLIEEEKEIKNEDDIEDAVLFDLPRHKWEKFVTRQKAKQCLEDVAAVIGALNEKAPKPDVGLYLITSHSGEFGGVV
jgi:hypothetical protein